MDEERVVPTEEERVEPEAEMSPRDMKVAKETEMKEKYAEVINDLCIKYGRTEDFGFEALKAIARAEIFGEEPLYTSNVEFNLDELVADEKELLVLCENV